MTAVTSLRDAVSLRAAALSMLTGRAPDWTLLEHWSPHTWRLFLRTERCALALKARIAAATDFPDGARAEIERAATRELQRVLSARGQLLRIGRLAAAHGIAAIVLKGGVAALISPAPVDVQDVDVLVRAHQAEQLAGLLDKEGFSATGPAGTGHLAQRIAPNEVQIEVHFALNEFELTDGKWNRARALDGVPGLARLAAGDHLWHLLVHSVVTHPHRRGSLRDVLLTAEGLADCAQSELRDLERLIAGHPLSLPLGDMFAMAREVREGVAIQDRFRGEAAANYLLRGPLGWLGFSRFWTPAFVSALFAQLGGMVERRREWAVAWERPPFSSPWRFAARLERWSPRVGRWSRTGMKLARLVVCRAAAWPVAVAARLLA